MAKLRKRRSPKALREIFERLVLSDLRAHVEDGDVVISKERPKRISTRAVYSARCQYIVGVYPDPEALINIFTSFKNAASEAEHYATSHHARVVYVEDEEPIVLADYRRRR